MPLVTYVRDENKVPLFAVVADDDGADYLFPDGVDPWLDQSRLDDIAQVMEQPPANAQEWLDLATYNMGHAGIDDPVEVESDEEAVQQIDQELAGAGDQLAQPGEQRLSEPAAVFDQLAADYPGQFDENDPESMSPEALTNYVLMALGPIDPNGPNGWIMRAQDGTPEEGDDEQYLTFSPGVDDSDDETQEPAPDDEQVETETK